MNATLIHISLSCVYIPGSHQQATKDCF